MGKNMKYEKCVFCGNSLVDSNGETVQYVLASGPAGNTIYLCQRCIDKGFKLIGSELPGFKKTSPKEETTSEKKCPVKLPDNFKVLPPKIIASELRKYVIGQDSYIRDLSVFAYNHLRRLQMVANGVPYDSLPKSFGMTVIGPTGSGKSYTVTKLAKIIGIPCVIADCTGLTEAGYVGGDVEDILKDLLIQCDGDVERMQTGLVVLDELDKIAEQKSVYARDVGGGSVQKALLKIAEGNELSKIKITNKGNKYQSNRSEVCITTQFMGFIGLGAFSGLKCIQKQQNDFNRLGFRTPPGDEAQAEEISYNLDEETLKRDLIAYGILPEFLGRFSYLSILEPHTVDSLVRILNESEDSVIKKEKERFFSEGIHLDFTNSAIRAIAARAFESKLGGRTLVAEVSKLLRDVAFEAFGTGAAQSVQVDVDCENEIKVEVEWKEAVEANA